MQKIQTIFDRNWEGNRGVIDKYVNEPKENWIATEKVDGTNVRLTVRNHQLVRVEKRRNPNDLERARGIVDPWYVDASEYEAQDKYIMEAAKNLDLNKIEDGEWGGEAVGEKIQGNPLKLVGHSVILFSHPETRRTKLTFTPNPKTDYESLYLFLKEQKSLIGKGVGIEGIVWWVKDNPVGKIKLKDFK